MADSESAVYEINFDTGKIEDGLEDLAGGLGALEIGDSTIGQAARRYERKMAVVTGGRY